MRLSDIVEIDNPTDEQIQQILAEDFSSELYTYDNFYKNFIIKIISRCMEWKNDPLVYKFIDLFNNNYELDDSLDTMMAECFKNGTIDHFDRIYSDKWPSYKVMFETAVWGGNMSMIEHIVKKLEEEYPTMLNYIIQDISFIYEISNDVSLSAIDNILEFAYNTFLEHTIETFEEQFFISCSSYKVNNNVIERMMHKPSIVEYIRESEPQTVCDIYGIFIKHNNLAGLRHLFNYIDVSKITLYTTYNLCNNITIEAFDIVYECYISKVTPYYFNHTLSSIINSARDDRVIPHIFENYKDSLNVNLVNRLVRRNSISKELKKTVEEYVANSPVPPNSPVDKCYNKNSECYFAARKSYSALNEFIESNYDWIVNKEYLSFDIKAYKSQGECVPDLTFPQYLYYKGFDFSNENPGYKLSTEEYAEIFPMVRHQRSVDINHIKPCIEAYIQVNNIDYLFPLINHHKYCDRSLKSSWYYEWYKINPKFMENLTIDDRYVLLKHLILSQLQNTDYYVDTCNKYTKPSPIIKESYDQLIKFVDKNAVKYFIDAIKYYSLNRIAVDYYYNYFINYRVIEDLLYDSNHV